MTATSIAPVKLIGTQLTTKSGAEIKIGTGTGTKWQKIKKARDSSQKDQILDELVEYLETSILNGYRHIDTAEIYTTHPEVAQALKKTSVRREELFLTTKYNPGVPSHPSPHKSGAASVDAALTELGVDYIDLFLIHFPVLSKEFSHGQTTEAVWKDLVAAKKAGKVRYIGVSNFSPAALQSLIDIADGDKDSWPQVNQIEFHPYLQNQTKGVRDFCAKHNILIEAYGPLTPLWRILKDEHEVTNHPLTNLIPKLTEKYGKTDAQILLRYTLQQGLLPVTTSSDPERQRQTLAVYDFALDEEDVELITTEGAKFYFRGFFVDFYKEHS